MSASRKNYGELEVRLHRSHPESYEVEIRVNDPGTEGEVTPVRKNARISLADLSALRTIPDEYGKVLTEQLFGDPAIREFYGTHKAVFDSRELMIRLRVSIGISVPELHGVRWELLRDPETKLPLATSERMLLSRFMFSRDWRAVKLRPKARLKALIAVAAPSDAAGWRLAEVNRDEETERARTALSGIQTAAIEKPEPVTLDRLMDGIRPGVDILYLVCHGMIPKGEREEPVLFLQNEQGGVVPVKASDLAERIRELQEPPRLIVLASCESAAREDGTFAQSALAPRLAEAGVPAVIAMQGQISMETVKLAMPVFFRELVTDGQIDRAMAVARGAVRERHDHWMPALFLRLKSGRIWYEPGFGVDGVHAFNKWKAICSQVLKGDFVPILGPELGDDVFGGTRELSNLLADKHAFPLATHERNDLAKVTQYLSADQDRTYPYVAVEKAQQQILERRDTESGNAGRPLPEYIKLAAERCQSTADHPYRSLTDLRASIYLNATYETTLLHALKEAGRKPEAVFSSWRGVDVPRRPQPKVVKPEPETPWVYHVFGLYGKPDTMVLTEDDFFDYLIASSRLDLLLPPLVGRLMQSSLLFLGFRLDDWRFRVLFRMIVTRQGTGTMRNLSHVGVQVNPDEQSLADVERARKYMESYLRGPKDAPEISIYWGSVAEFFRELNQHLAEMREEETAAVAEGGSDEYL